MPVYHQKHMLERNLYKLANEYDKIEIIQNGKGIIEMKNVNGRPADPIAVLENKIEVETCLAHND